MPIVNRLLMTEVKVMNIMRHWSIDIEEMIMSVILLEVLLPVH